MSKVSTAAKMAKVNELLRSWNIRVSEEPGAWQRDNGVKDWTFGEPVGFLNHHFVIPLSSPERNGIQNVTYGDSKLAGPKCNWYVHTSGITFIAMGPANHAGKGDSGVLKRAMDDLPYNGRTAPDNYSYGTSVYMGQEAHHPGDNTPWPEDLIYNIVALNAAVCIVFGFSPNRMLNHKWHTTRKIDMSPSFPDNIQESTAAFIRQIGREPSPEKTPVEKEEEMAASETYLVQFNDTNDIHVVDFAGHTKWHVRDMEQFALMRDVVGIPVLRVKLNADQMEGFTDVTWSEARMYDVVERVFKERILPLLPKA